MSALGHSRPNHSAPVPNNVRYCPKPDKRGCGRIVRYVPIDGGMDHFAGLDVSVKETSICIVDDTGKIVGEAKVAIAYHFKRIGLEAGPLSQWLFSALGEANLPIICVETRHMRAVLKAQINKTDRNDARGMAQMMRAGLYRPVHVKTLRSQKLRMLLTHRKLLQSKAIAVENDLRGTLLNFGLKVGIVGKLKFEARIKELVESHPDLVVLVEPLLVVRRVLREQIAVLHRCVRSSFGSRAGYGADLPGHP